MGKGDKKTRRGKLFQGSFGVRRPKKSTKSVPPPPVNKPVEIKAEKPVKELKEVREKESAPVKAPKAAAATAKKAPKTKKQADSAT